MKREKKQATISASIIDVINKSRGASAHMVENDLSFKGMEYSNNMINVIICGMVKKGLLWKETMPCKCCRKDNVYYYATDQGKIAAS